MLAYSDLHSWFGLLADVVVHVLIDVALVHGSCGVLITVWAAAPDPHIYDFGPVEPRNNPNVIGFLHQYRLKIPSLLLLHFRLHRPLLSVRYHIF